MAEHSDLVTEMAQMDKMSTQERLKLARRRRMQQLKRCSQREKEYNNKRKKEQKLSKKTVRNNYKVHFVPSVMLLEAASRNDIEEVRRLLMLGVSPDSTNEDGLTALHQCCIDDSNEMLRLLLEFGASVNAKDSEQWTPLHAAATCGHLHIVKYLISKSADLLAVNADGNMPYDICDDDNTLDYIENEMAKQGVTQEIIDQTRAATENKMLEDLKNLLAEGKDLNFVDEQGATFLHVAAANGYLLVMEFLLEQNHLIVDACDDDLWQPIHAAACWGHPDAIELLVQAGAHLNAKTKNGETPYDISEDVEVRERIMQLKFEMETKRGSQSNRLRRSHSQNTRSQSIRRTSIREKSQISRRDAREEALLRQETANAKMYDSEDETKQQIVQPESSKFTDVDPQDIDISFLPLGGKDTLQKFKIKNVTDFLGHVEHLQRSSKKEQPDLPNIKNHNNNDVQHNADVKAATSEEINKTPKSLSPSVETTSVIQQNSGQSVNVEIHVTVNTSPTYPLSHGTLSDLKKHRNTHRNSISSNSSQQETSNDKCDTRNGHYGSNIYACNNPPSPTTTPRKFKGDPLEVVGGKKKRACCCII